MQARAEALVLKYGSVDLEEHKRVLAQLEEARATEQALRVSTG